MKTIGMIGGVSWLSTADYYRIINQEVQKQLGENHSAKIIMHSLDFYEVVSFINNNEENKLFEMVITSAKKLEHSGADCLLICANSLHMLVDNITDYINIPLIHIANATLDKIKEKGMTRIGLLGTMLTMEKDFYKKVFNNNGIDILIPNPFERKYINDTIFQELTQGIINPASEKRINEIARNLYSAGAQGIILGCTEIPMLFQKESFPFPLFNTTRIHAAAAAKFALT